MIGLHVGYSNSLNTYTGLRVGQMIEACGYECSLFAIGPRAACVHSEWDHRIRHGDRADYKKWLRSCEQIVFINRVGYRELTLSTVFRKRTVLFASWNCLHGADQLMAQSVDAFVCPSWQISQLVKEHWQVQNLYYAPWEPGIPITRQSDEGLDNPAITVLIPRRRSLLTINWLLAFVPSLVALVPNVRIRLVYVHRPARHTLRTLRHLARSFAPSVCLLSARSWENFLQILGSGYITTILDTEFDSGTGLMPTTSIALGVPIIAPDVPLLREYLNNGLNAMLINCNADDTHLYAPDPVDFAHAAEKLIQQKNAWRKLRRGCYRVSIERRKLMLSRWREILKS